jgi:O-antigen ligase
LIVLIGEIAGGIVALVKPYLGLLCLLFLVFGRPQDDRPNVVALHVPLVITLAVLVGTVARLGTMKEYLVRACKQLWLVWLYFGLMIVSAAANGFTMQSTDRLNDFSTVIVLCLMALTWLSTETRLSTFIWALIGCGLYIFQISLRNPRFMQEQIGGSHYTRMDLGGANLNFGRPNYLACLMAILLIMCISLLTARLSKWINLVLLGCCGCFAFVMFRANSRGATLGIIVALLAFWLIQPGKLRNALLLLLLAVFAYFAAPTEYWDRLSTISNYKEDASATSRLELWDIGLKLIAENPVLGIGPDNFQKYAFNSPHDAYIQAASEMGIPALFVYVAILFSGFRAIWQVRTLSGSIQIQAVATGVGIFGGLLIITVQGFTTGLAHREFVYMFVTLAYALKNIATDRPEELQLDSPQNIEAVA